MLGLILAICDTKKNYFLLHDFRLSSITIREVFPRLFAMSLQKSYCSIYEMRTWWRGLGVGIWNGGEISLNGKNIYLMIFGLDWVMLISGFEFLINLVFCWSSTNYTSFIIWMIFEPSSLSSFLGGIVCSLVDQVLIIILLSFYLINLILQFEENTMQPPYESIALGIN